MHSIAQYEIAFNHHDHMFDVFCDGTRIDSMLPSYSDGENSIQLHQAIEAAEQACETPMQRAFRCVYSRYPNATYGLWQDYMENTEELVTEYAVIAITRYGYGVHRVTDGGLGEWVESVFAHELQDTPHG